MREKGLLIALEGADGVGKSTLAPLIAAQLEDLGAIFSSNKHVANEPTYVSDRMASLRRMLWPGGEIEGGKELPPSYWILLQAAWYSLSSEFVMRPLVDGGNVVIVDGWYGKSWARAALKGCEGSFLSSLFESVIAPDLVVYLDVDLRAVFQRKSFRQHEVGGYHDYPSYGLDSYIDFQNRLASALLESTDSGKLIHAELTATDSPALNAEIVAENLRKRLPIRH